MITVLQIALLLILIALIGIILGYLFGKLSCKKQSQSRYFEKNDYCESEYIASNALLNDLDSDLISENKKIEETLPPILTEETEALEDSSKSIESISSNETKAEKFIDTEVPKESKEQKEDTPQEETAKEEKIEKEDDKAQKELVKQEEAKKEDDKPTVLDAPRNGEPDNLCRIKGIGFVIEEKLHNLGIYHFDQIAAWTEKEIAWVDKHLAFSGRIIREDWIGQAKKLAAGEETEFSKKVDAGKVSTSRKTKK